MNSYQPTRIGAGMGLMLLAGFSFSGMDALLVKLALLTPDLSSPHRVFLRHLIGAPLAILVALSFVSAEARLGLALPAGGLRWRGACWAFLWRSSFCIT